MYAFLLLLGGVITAAGLTLVASGISIEQHSFDPTNITPGTIAIIGGCILIGLAFVVRGLLRVERALMMRPMLRPARPGESSDAAVSAAQPSEAARIPFPPKPKTTPQPQPVSVAATTPALAEAAVPETMRASSPERIENPPVVEESDVSLLPRAPVRAEEESGEARHAGVGRTNGSAAGRTAPPPAVMSGRPARRPQQQAKSSIFDALWPKTQRAVPDINTAPAAAHSAAAPPPASASQPVEAAAVAPADQVAAASHETAIAVSIVKSGVVEGMAYTLYSDGSIEAQLPGGTLRFGSITELRNHIEQNG